MWTDGRDKAILGQCEMQYWILIVTSSSGNVQDLVINYSIAPQSVVYGPAGPLSSASLLEGENLRPQPKPAESETTLW